MVEPSPLQYFGTAAQQRRNTVRGKHSANSLSELERQVASCFVVMQETAANLAAVAVTNGVASIERYLPSMHEALAHLQQFHLSLVIAPCYGAYIWPNIELKAFADSLAEIGIDMKYQPEIDGNSKSVTGQKISAVGVALLQNVNKMRELASSAYLFGEDLTRVVVLSWRWFKHAEAVFDELLIEAWSAKELKGYVQQNGNLVGLIREYSQMRRVNNG